MMAGLQHGDLGYKGLRALVKLQPGPLYHHLTCLKLAGLVRKRGRDRYQVTPTGRRLIRAVPGLLRLLADR
jgi:predicted transcriptional regulator